MATTTCDNCNVVAARLVTDLETGAPHFYCMDHYGEVQSNETLPEFRETCEQCDSEPVSIVLTQPQSGLRMQLGNRCYLVNGRMAWRSANPDELEALDELASLTLDAVSSNGKPKGGRRKRVAVHDEGSDPETVAAEPEAAREPVGVGAEASDAAASDAED